MSLYEKHEDVGRRIRTTEDLTFANGSKVARGSTGRVVRVEPAGSLGLVWVARMDTGEERGFTEGQFAFEENGAKANRHRRNQPRRDEDFIPEADEPTYGLEEAVHEADLYSNRRRRPLRRNSDEEIRSLERQALEGDADAVRRLAAMAMRSTEPVEGIVLRPQPWSVGARSMRNFWVTLSVDGKASQVATGPSRADGGFSLTVLMRDSGGAVKAMDVAGLVRRDGKLELQVDGKTALVTER
jgi:hypothetical protein